MSKGSLNLINRNTHEAQTLAMPIPKGMWTGKSRISTVISKASYDYLQPFTPHAHINPVIINPLRCVGRCCEIYDMMDIRL
jgi:hypothetical protein